MYRSLIPALSALLLVAPAARADDDARAIVAKAIKAHGGEDALAKFQAGQATTKGKIDIPGLGETDFTQNIAFMQPDKLKDELELTVGGQKVTIVTLVNGDAVSIEANGNKVDVTDAIKESIKDARYMIGVSRLVSLVRDKDYELSPVGEAKVEGKEAIGVRVSRKGQKDVNLFFDKKTGLLVKIEHRTVEPGGGNEITQERIFLEYRKDENGLPVPKKVLINHDGKKFLEADVDMNYREKLDDAEFKK